MFDEREGNSALVSLHLQLLTYRLLITASVKSLWKMGSWNGACRTWGSVGWSSGTAAVKLASCGSVA